MIHFRIRFIVLLFFPLAAMSQGHEFLVENFRENIMDLTAIRSNLKDINNNPAALIRFAVRDTLFELDPNQGCIKIEKRAGEICLYVPQQTKRITIRHPKLGVLRDYNIPVEIRSKVTYDADIRITNQTYLQSLMGEVSADKSKTFWNKKAHPLSEAHLLLGAGFQLGELSGPAISGAISVGPVVIEGGYVFGAKKIEGIAVYTRNGDFYSGYNYSISQMNAKIGLELNPKQKVIVALLAGVSFNQFNGEVIEPSSLMGDYYNYDSHDGDELFKQFYTTSALGAVRLQWAITKNIRLHVTPEYHFAVGSNNAYDVLKEADSAFKSVTEGINVQAGVIFCI